MKVDVQVTKQGKVLWKGPGDLTQATNTAEVALPRQNDPAYAQLPVSNPLQVELVDSSTQATIYSGDGVFGSTPWPVIGVDPTGIRP